MGFWARLHTRLCVLGIHFRCCRVTEVFHGTDEYYCENTGKRWLERS